MTSILHHPPTRTRERNKLCMSFSTRRDDASMLRCFASWSRLAGAATRSECFENIESLKLSELSELSEKTESWQGLFRYAISIPIISKNVFSWYISYIVIIVLIIMQDLRHFVALQENKADKNYFILFWNKLKIIAFFSWQAYFSGYNGLKA